MSESQKSESAVSSPALKGNKVRRKLSAEKKFQIYLEAQMGDQAVGEILRREGLYATDLTRIRDQVREGGAGTTQCAARQEAANGYIGFL